MTYDGLVSRLKAETDHDAARNAIATAASIGRIPADIAAILASQLAPQSQSASSAAPLPTPSIEPDAFEEDTVPHAFAPSAWPDAGSATEPTVNGGATPPGPSPRSPLGVFPPGLPAAAGPNALPGFDSLKTRVDDAVLSDLIGDYKGLRQSRGDIGDEPISRRPDALDGLLGSYRSARFRSDAKRAVRHGATAGSTLGKLSDFSTQRAGIGSILRDRFILDSEVGRGGMGIVYSAVDRRRLEAGSAQPYVALKLLNDDFRNNSNALRTLEAEARKSQALAHPNIATVFDFDRDKAEVFIVMELLSGKPLSRLLASSTGQPMPIGTIASVLKGMCAGLAHAHAKGVIHSDLKPGNIFVGDNNHVKLIDFGLATATTVDGFNAGELEALTAAYASPEMFLGAQRDPRDDIFALGCITYQMFMGFHPFAMKPGIDAHLLEMKPEPIPDLDPAAWEAILGALSFDREERIASVEAFASAVFES